MAEDAITRDGIRGLGSPLYICEFDSLCLAYLLACLLASCPALQMPKLTCFSNVELINTISFGFPVLINF